MSASDDAAAFLAESTKRNERAAETRGETGDYARLRELIAADGDLSDAEAEEFADLAGKWRSGSLEGSPTRTVRKRQSIAGERNDVVHEPKPKSASEQAASFLRGYN